MPKKAAGWTMQIPERLLPAPLNQLRSRAIGCDSQGPRMGWRYRTIMNKELRRT
jgi:hypothetical protein